MRRRLSAWLVAAGILVVVLVTVAVVALLRSQTSGCTVAAPIPSLPAQLRTIGEFDQPYDANDEGTLKEVAQRVAVIVHPRLLGTSAQRPVPVVAVAPADHDALVVPLTAPISPSGPGRLAGLVSFLRDCAGRAYYSDAVELAAGSGSGTPLPTFPSVSREQAAMRLGTDDVELVYSRTPFKPRWRNPGSAREVAAM